MLLLEVNKNDSFILIKQNGNDALNLIWMGERGRYLQIKAVILIKLAKMVGVMHEADHAYSIQSTW